MNAKGSSDSPDDATPAAPEQTPASAETQPAAETASPASTEAGADGTAGGEGKSKRERPRARSRAHKRARSAAGESADRSGAAAAGAPRGLAERLLAPIELPKVRLDPRLLPPKLLGALDAAGLGAPHLLPSATFMALATIAAIAGPAVRCEPVDGIHGVMGSGLSLRVALLVSDRRSVIVPAAIMAGAYAVENDLLGVYQDDVRQAAEQRQAAAQRRRLHEQAIRTAAALGIATPPPLPDTVPAEPGPRPRIVVPDGGSSAIRTAAAGATGLLVVDERRMPTMANVGNNYDLATDGLLNVLALGHQVAVADPVSSRNVMRSFPASVIGLLTASDYMTLHKAARVQLASTVFVAATPPPADADSSPLIALMRKVRAMTDRPIVPHLATPANTLATSAAAWAARAAATRAPLADHLAGLADLTWRLAASLHLAAAASGDGSSGRGITQATVKRALAIVDTCVVPVAQALLGPISTAEAERDAQRVIAYLRETTSAAHRRFERRVLVRAWQRSMTVVRLDAALSLLQEAGLLVDLDKEAGRCGQRFEVAAAVLDGV